MENHEVVIAGGGPTGLMLACELSLCGVRPLVLEALPAPTGLSKALGFGGRAVDILDHRGILDRFQGKAPPGLGDILRFVHFGGLPLDLRRARGLDFKFVPLLQADTEATLDARARELGVEVRRGHEVVGLEQGSDAVRISVRANGRERELSGAYLVGCDGGRSTVRKLAGIAFPGTEPTMLLRLSDVKMPGLPTDAPLPFGMVRIGPEYFRVTTLEPYPQGFDRDSPMTLEELRESLRRTHGRDLPVAEPRWLSRFTDASRQAAQYRVGRVFLAGDAAHIHLPSGGPGLSTGLNDAANLGWKLAASVKGWAPTGLLDTYNSERHPVGERVLMHTRVQAMLLRPSEQRQSLRQLFTELLQDEATILRIGNLLAGNTRYAPDAQDAHPLAGTWAPDLKLNLGQKSVRLAELMHRARGVLAVFGRREVGAAPSALARAAQNWADRVDAVDAIAEGDPPASAVLIRPDGYLAWAAPADGAETQIEAGLRAALEKWFGPQTWRAHSAPQVGE